MSDGFDPARESHREALTTLEIVNVPSWLPFDAAIEDGGLRCSGALAAPTSDVNWTCAAAC